MMHNQFPITLAIVFLGVFLIGYVFRKQIQGQPILLAPLLIVLILGVCGAAALTLGHPVNPFAHHNSNNGNVLVNP
jgi:hypothetical protein